MDFFEKGLAKGICSFIIKYIAVILVLTILLVASIMLRYQISLGFILHGNDPVIYSELEHFLDIKNIALDILQAFPLLSKIPFVNEIFGTSTNFWNAMISDVSSLQRFLFGEFFFFLLSLVIFKPLLYCYSLLRKLVNRSFGPNLLSYLGDFICCLQIAYIGTICVILIRDFLLNTLFDNSAVLTYIIIVVIILLGSLLLSLFTKKNGIKVFEKAKEFAGKTLIELLYITLIYVTVLFVAILMSSTGAVATIAAISSVICILIVTILFAVRFSEFSKLFK